MVAYKLSAGHIIYCDAAAGTHNWMLYGTDLYNEASSGDYLLVTPPEGLAGGLDPRGEKPVLYIEVDSIPETLKKIEELDGKTVLAEMKIDTGDGGDYGKIGLFADPEGTLLGLWSK